MECPKMKKIEIKKILMICDMIEKLYNSGILK